MGDGADLSHQESADQDRQESRLSRRQLIRWWGPVAAVGAALGGAGWIFHERDGRHREPHVDPLAATLPDWRVVQDPGRIAIAGGEGPAANLSRALAGLGGIESFIRAGDRVLIKPNCAWDRRPEQAANTNPELVAELVRLCFAVGALSVVVADNSCHDPERAFQRSGISPAATAAGARIMHQNSTGTVLFDLGGTTLGQWQVLAPLAEADRIINVPIVKHHSLARVTVGMKNWIGAVVGQRPSLHQRLSQITAELGAAFRPTLTVVDATRVLFGGGPTGGSLDLVKTLDQIAVATDPVAADAWGASLLEVTATELEHLGIAQRLGLGTADWQSVQVEV
jgi:uncharacterized protein (DUF362 family)